MHTSALSLVHHARHALTVAALIGFSYLVLHAVVGQPYLRHAVHELHHAFVFAVLLVIGLTLTRKR